MVTPRRLLTAMLAAVLAQLGLAAEPIQLVVWGEVLGPDTKGMEAKIRDFEKKNPDIVVKILSMGAGKMNPQKLMTAIVGNVAPDVISQDRFTISDWASRGAFLSLDEFIERDKGKDPLCPVPEQYYPAPWKEAMYEGKVFAIPNSSDDRVLYYNKSVFREHAAKLRAAGLDPERPPRTWSEVLAYSKVLTLRSKDGALERVGFLPNYGNSWLYLYSFQANGTFMSPDGTKCTLASPETEEALKFMVAGYDILGGYEEAKKFQDALKGGERDPFITGKVAMKVDGDWIITSLARYGPKLEFGTAPAPVPDDRYYRRGRFKDEKDQFITWVGGFSLAIPKGARNVEAAWRYIKYMSSVEAAIIDYSASQEWERRRGRIMVPRVMANKAINEVAFRKFAPADPRFQSALKTHIDMMPYARFRPSTFVGQLLWDEQIRAMEAACMHRRTPMEALKISQAVVQKELDARARNQQYPVIDMRLPAWAGLFGAIIASLMLATVYKRRKLGRTERTEAKWAYLFLSPWIIGFFAFTLGPMIASLFFSFTEYNVLSPARWVGGKNYAELASDEQNLLAKSFLNVLYLGGIGVPLGLVTGLAIALLLNNAVRGIRFYRTAFYLPSIVPAIASIVLWVFIMNPDSTRGLINGLWQSTITEWFKVQPPGWFSVEAWAKPGLVMMGLWGAGGGMILWLAGLKAIPNTLYEAASIDGATPKQQFWSVTLPQLTPIIFFNTVMGFVGALQQFEAQYVITKGENAGPADALLTPVYLLFRNGFAYFKMGYASALAWVIFAIILALTLFQFKIAPRWVHYEVDK